MIEALIGSLFRHRARLFYSVRAVQFDGANAGACAALSGYSEQAICDRFEVGDWFGTSGIVLSNRIFRQEFEPVEGP